LKLFLLIFSAFIFIIFPLLASRQAAVRQCTTTHFSSTRLHKNNYNPKLQEHKKPNQQQTPTKKQILLF